MEGLVFAEFVWDPPVLLPDPFNYNPIVTLAYLPNYPYSLDPQVNSLPSIVKAAECLLPADIETIPSSKLDILLGRDYLKKSPCPN